MSGLRARMQAGDALAGTFVKTPAHEVIEVLALSGLDFLCLDAEHAPFDRARLDTCLAIGRALGVEMLVRVPSAAPENLLMALDAGATGVVVPHIRSAQEAAETARAARFGRGGRGYAGSTRWAHFGTGTMADNLARSEDETVVIAQIEDVEGLKDVEAIAATPGIDALFLGPADLSVAMGQREARSPELDAAYARVGRAVQSARRTFATWVSTPEHGKVLRKHGVGMLFVASEHAWILSGAKAVARDLQAKN